MRLPAPYPDGAGFFVSVFGARIYFRERPERTRVPTRLPREKDGPVFAEPWEAQAFALAVKLSEQGNGLKLWVENFSRPRIVANPTMARVTTSIGWQPLNAW